MKNRLLRRIVHTIWRKRFERERLRRLLATHERETRLWNEHVGKFLQTASQQNES
jgi:hypothetical protein